ncbi:hypothetical protein L2E82_47316 [Cichorium intybus]|uniref:Uncharacterized protein n=1 Tax=Cichorium intybus TaxID=13427 RepID=A0ACB8YV94_CICIN|nr:hypothetical protein L2E82_47316 [Cichorium intybus]
MAYASYMGFTVYQMDVKIALLYGEVKEEIYVDQPPGFVNSKFPNHVYNMDKALYGLHQAPRAWYATVTEHLLNHGYTRGTIYQTLFIKQEKTDLIVVQIYVDDIIFGSTSETLCKEFENVMKKRFEISSLGEMTMFLGLQVQSSSVLGIGQGTRSGNTLSHTQTHENKARRTQGFLRGSDSVSILHPRATTKFYLNEEITRDTHSTLACVVCCGASF